jgi:hypothetical protein
MAAGLLLPLLVGRRKLSSLSVGATRPGQTGRVLTDLTDGKKVSIEGMAASLNPLKSSRQC